MQPVRNEAQRSAELNDALKTIAVLDARLADKSLMAAQEPATIESWRQELAKAQRRAATLRATSGALKGNER
jgi:hypothetical protein